MNKLTKILDKVFLVVSIVLQALAAGILALVLYMMYIFIF